MNGAMEDIIKRIIDLEHNAQNQISLGETEAEKILKSGLEECRMMEAQILEMAENKIKQIQSKSIRDKEDRIIRIYEDTAIKMRLMEENAEQNQQQWEDEIFNRIIRGE
jgi:vacuolar-type H+-ATPase subunit H